MNWIISKPRSESKVPDELGRIDASRSCGLQDLFGADVFHQLIGPHEVGAESLAVTEELFGLIVPVAGLFVVAFTQRDDGIRLRADRS